jgi:chaperone required for assembly of F1-ATPase
MTEWAPKVFWNKAEVFDADDGFGVALDGRPVRTPAKSKLILPTRSLAVATAAEWAAQQETVNPLLMPYTRMANAALDKVSVQHAEVAMMLADYGDSDLLCYRADGPDDLVARQTATWDPMLDWARTILGVRLQVRTGVMHVPQDPAALAKLRDMVMAFDEFRLAAFHDLVTLSGSLILGVAAAKSARPADELWEMSRLDELWQIEKWGDDDAAIEAAEVKHQAFRHSYGFFHSC